MAPFRHNNFVLVSGLMTQNRLVHSGLVANVSETNAKNLETIASLLADLLLCINTPEDARFVLCAFCYTAMMSVKYLHWVISL